MTRILAPLMLLLILPLAARAEIPSATSDPQYQELLAKMKEAAALADRALSVACENQENSIAEKLLQNTEYVKSQFANVMHHISPEGFSSIVSLHKKYLEALSGYNDRSASISKRWSAILRERFGFFESHPQLDAQESAKQYGALLESTEAEMASYTEELKPLMEEYNKALREYAAAVSREFSDEKWLRVPYLRSLNANMNVKDLPEILNIQTPNFAGYIGDMEKIQILFRDRRYGSVELEYRFGDDSFSISPTTISGAKHIAWYYLAEECKRVYPQAAQQIPDAAEASRIPIEGFLPRARLAPASRAIERDPEPASISGS